jgi:hypothetical protein
MAWPVQLSIQDLRHRQPGVAGYAGILCPAIAGPDPVAGKSCPCPNLQYPRVRRNTRNWTCRAAGWARRRCWTLKTPGFACGPAPDPAVQERPREGAGRLRFCQAHPFRQAGQAAPSHAREVLDAGRGDAPDKAAVLVALLRLVRIPGAAALCGAARRHPARPDVQHVASAARPMAEIWLNGLGAHRHLHFRRGLHGGSAPAPEGQ